MTAGTMRSALAGPLRRFLEHKRALNRKYRNEEAALRLFDTYLAAHGVGGFEDVDSALIERFLQSRPRNARSHNHLLGVLRLFFAWAVVQRLIAKNPVTARPRRVRGRVLPFLFDVATMRRVLEAARQLPARCRNKHRPLVYEMALALVFGLGLRVSEAARLRLGDWDLKRGTLLVRKSKFGKTRLLPMGPNLARRLATYVAAVHGAAHDGQAPLFSLTPGRRVRPDTLSGMFRELCATLDLRPARGMATPRLHHLRHSFAVNRLLRWYREGVDVNSRLLQLSVFPGHVHPRSTAVYLTITADLLAEADRRFRDFARPEDLA